MRGDEHSEMSPSLGFDGLAVCIVQSANLIPRLSTERFGLLRKAKRRKVERDWKKKMEKAKESIDKFDFHAHARCS